MAERMPRNHEKLQNVYFTYDPDADTKIHSNFSYVMKKMKPDDNKQQGLDQRRKEGPQHFKREHSPKPQGISLYKQADQAKYLDISMSSCNFAINNDDYETDNERDRDRRRTRTRSRRRSHGRGRGEINSFSDIEMDYDDNDIDNDYDIDNEFDIDLDNDNDNDDAENDVEVDDVDAESDYNDNSERTISDQSTISETASDSTNVDLDLDDENSIVNIDNRYNGAGSATMRTSSSTSSTSGDGYADTEDLNTSNDSCSFAIGIGIGIGVGTDNNNDEMDDNDPENYTYLPSNVDSELIGRRWKENQSRIDATDEYGDYEYDQSEEESDLFMRKMRQQTPTIIHLPLPAPGEEAEGGDAAAGVDDIDDVDDIANISGSIGVCADLDIDGGDGDVDVGIASGVASGDNDTYCDQTFNNFYPEQEQHQTEIDKRYYECQRRFLVNRQWRRESGYDEAMDKMIAGPTVQRYLQELNIKYRLPRY